MREAVATVVTFKSSAFNTTEQREYFMNPGCFGDDVAKWLIDVLRAKGCKAENPGQEDFGWYFNFEVEDTEHCCILGYRPEQDKEDGSWIGWMERSRGFIGSIFGDRQRGILLAASRAIHDILSNSSQIRDIRWHLKRDFDKGKEEAGTTQPF